MTLDMFVCLSLRSCYAFLSDAATVYKLKITPAPLHTSVTILPPFLLRVAISLWINTFIVLISLYRSRLILFTANIQSLQPTVHLTTLLQIT